MLKVGITGGIGSGKTTVAKIFEVLGIPVYYADDAARNLVNEDEQIRQAIISEFGKESYTGNQLNRPFIATIVFNDKSKLEKLNAITHPATIEHANEWMKKQHSPYTLKEAALLFESGSVEHLDYVIGVYSPIELRIKRIMARDHISAEDVQKRIDRQMNEEEKMKRCHTVIINDEKQPVLPQVLQLHEKLLRINHSL